MHELYKMIFYIIILWYNITIIIEIYYRFLLYNVLSIFNKIRNHQCTRYRFIKSKFKEKLHCVAKINK